jgi:hypothetical protein
MRLTNVVERVPINGAVLETGGTADWIHVPASLVSDHVRQQQDWFSMFTTKDDNVTALEWPLHMMCPFGECARASVCWSVTSCRPRAALSRVRAAEVPEVTVIAPSVDADTWKYQATDGLWLCLWAFFVVTLSSFSWRCSMQTT